MPPFMPTAALYASNDLNSNDDRRPDRYYADQEDPLLQNYKNAPMNGRPQERVQYTRTFRETSA
ncbi:hypothetical protein AAVH_24516 [Aphelenchoides avenae]|nr:hypothetical protein AAVH_24516 [Aphelenchus avenae]